MEQLHILGSTEPHRFDARGIAKRFRHAAIVGAFDALYRGEVMHFINDHDPLPLLEQLRNRYGEKIGIEYVERGPEQVVLQFTRF